LAQESSLGKGSDSPFRGAGKDGGGRPALGDIRAYAWGAGDSLYLVDGPRVRRIGVMESSGWWRRLPAR